MRPDNAAFRAAKIFLLDTLSVGISGSAAPGAAAIRQVAQSWGDGEKTSILGADFSLPKSSAAFVNAFQIHCQEFDCVHEQAVVHAMSVTTAAMLSELNDERISGEHFLRSLICGVDLACAMGVATTSGLRFFRPATAGAFGAVLAVSMMRNASSEQLLQAWGHVYSQIPGTMQSHVEGAITLPMQVGYAARAAINAVQFSETSLSAPVNVFDGDFGYFNLIEDEWDEDYFAHKLGEKWLITELSHKPFPTGRAAHAILATLQELQQEHEFTLYDCDNITAYVPELIFRLVARPISASMKVSYARLCLQYLVPNLLLDGALTASSYRAERMTSEKILSYGARVNIEQNDNPDPNAMSPQRLVLELKDGRRFDERIPYTLGSPDRPLTREQYLHKFHRCCSEAQTEISMQQQKSLLEMVENLEHEPDAARLLVLCQARSS